MDQQYPDLKLQLRCDMLVGGGTGLFLLVSFFCDLKWVCI